MVHQKGLQVPERQVIYLRTNLDDHEVQRHKFILETTKDLAKALAVQCKVSIQKLN